MSDFEQTFQKALRAASKSKPLPRGTRHSISLQAEGDARSAAEGTPVVRPLPRGTSVAALRRHAGQLWHRYHRNEILTTPEMMFDYATSAARLYIKTFVAAFQAEVRHLGRPDPYSVTTAPVAFGRPGKILVGDLVHPRNEPGTFVVTEIRGDSYAIAPALVEAYPKPGWYPEHTLAFIGRGGEVRNPIALRLIGKWQENRRIEP